MISKEEVGKIAGLARLELTEQEIEKMQKDLSGILDYFDLLKKAPKVKIEKSVLENPIIARKDEVISSHDLADGIIEGFPDKKDNFIKVKTIL